MKKIDLIGKKVGWVTVIDFSEPVIRGRKKSLRYVCLCDCGNIVLKESVSLLTKKHIPSCGCYQQFVRKRSGKHRMTKTKLYRVWSFMKERCLNPNTKQYHNYGGRGICVCDAWLESFMNFYNNMGSSYLEGLQLDRINNDGNYEKDNCRWVTHKENNRNKRRNRILQVYEFKNCVAWFLDALGLESTNYLIMGRLKLKWSDEDAVLSRDKVKREINYDKIKEYYESNKK